jgi:rare lipoprotein A
MGSVFLVVAGVGCVSAERSWSSAEAPSTRGTRLVGEASYYADKFNGRTTASGDVYDPHALTAAHKTLPFGTRVRVTRLDTGASVEVRINDRGPFKNGRIIDLSKAAARHIDMMVIGVTDVEVVVLSEGSGQRASPPARRTGRGW